MKNPIKTLKNIISEETELFVLNVITIIGFCLYAYGIYLHVAIRGLAWGNMAIDLSINILGPVFGVIMRSAGEQ